MRDDIAYDTTVYAVAARRLNGEPYPVTIEQAIAQARAALQHRALVWPPEDAAAWEQAVGQAHQFLQRLLAPVA